MLCSGAWLVTERVSPPSSGYSLWSPPNGRKVRWEASEVSSK